MKKIFVVLIFLFTFCSAYAEYWHFTIVNKTQSTYYLYCAPTQGSEIKIGDTWCGILANVHQVPPGTLDVYADPHLIEHYEGNLYLVPLLY